MDEALEIDIDIVTTVDDALLEGVARLLPQLAPRATIPSIAQLLEIVSSPVTTLLVARDWSRGGHVVGALTLVRYRIPTGLRAVIEDVVVDVRGRGKGVGEALTREALRLAHTQGATSVDLTSNPKRTVANQLYQRIGFERRDTNVYRYDLSRFEAV
jgi:ribosomal protein S18 acetylase RimI-like enzyme